jgi:3-hydroxybutyryl-CoA dehydrogenase
MKVNFQREVTQGKLSQEKSDEALNRIHPRTRLAELNSSEIVLESVIEDLRIKKDLFRHLEAGTKPTSILASTTSSLSITAIASATKHPEKVVGLHFLGPPDTAPLIEIVRGQQSSPETIERVSDFLKQLGIATVTVNDSPGFLVNRVSQPLYDEPIRILAEGIAEVEQIDRLVKVLGGFTAGPFESMDKIGLDVVLAIRQALYDQSYGEHRFRPHPMLRQMVDSGRTGVKSGRGFYPHSSQ